LVSRDSPSCSSSCARQHARKSFECCVGNHFQHTIITYGNRHRQAQMPPWILLHTDRPQVAQLIRRHSSCVSGLCSEEECQEEEQQQQQVQEVVQEGKVEGQRHEHQRPSDTRTWPCVQALPFLPLFSSPPKIIESHQCTHRRSLHAQPRKSPSRSLRVGSIQRRSSCKIESGQDLVDRVFSSGASESATSGPKLFAHRASDC
jgi:hypothetical protein